MKSSLSILVCLIALTSCAQKKPIKEIPVADGTEYEYTLLPSQDSLRWYNGEQDTFRVYMRFEKVSNGFPLPDVITETDNSFNEVTASVLKYTPATFSGDNILNPLGWNFSKDQLFNLPHHDKTLSSLQTDGWVEYTFYGYRVDYYAEQFESYGIAGVSIDKGPETMVDLYQPTNQNNSRLVFSADSLKEGSGTSHVIRVRYTAQRNPNANSGSARINLDKFVTYYHQGIYYQPKQQHGQPKSSH